MTTPMPPAGPYGTPPEQPQPPRKRRHWIRNTFIAAGAVIVLIVVISVAAGGGTASSPRSSTIPAVTAPATPAATAAPVPVPTVVPATGVRFVITGNVPAGDFSEVDITYGSDADSHDVTLPSLSGRVAYNVPFDGSAEFYDVSVNFTGSGQVSCKIVVTGPAPDVPTAVAHGTATSSGADSGGLCTAQAAPDDSTGESWEQE